jgi:UDP-N-acetyl-D-mannosaminuronic acid dehydrogenase
MNYSQICFLGLGYIGLPTAAIIAGKGFSVLGVDINEEIVDTINKGEVHISEPGIDELVKKVVTGVIYVRHPHPKSAMCI